MTNIIIQGNVITNGLDLCDSKCIHNDGIQGWNWDDKLGITNKNIVIDSNYIQSQTVASLPFAVALQGIDIFDGFWENVSITNNVVLTSSITGISIAGVNGLDIIDNSVMNIPINGVSQSQTYWMYTGITWITAGGTTHEGGTTSNVVVRNNISPLIAATAAASGNCPITESYCSHTANSSVEQDHNLSLVQTTYAAPNLFVYVRHRHGSIQSRAEGNGDNQSSDRDWQFFLDAHDRFFGPSPQPRFTRLGCLRGSPLKKSKTRSFHERSAPTLAGKSGARFDAKSDNDPATDRRRSEQSGAGRV